jgi:hypothetical protein
MEEADLFTERAETGFPLILRAAMKKYATKPGH